MSRLSNGDVLLRWPLDKHIITAGWTYNSGAAHNALDLRCTWNGTTAQPVYAAEDGTVAIAYHWNGKVTSGDTNSYGNMVKLTHANYNGGKLETLYAHLSSIAVKAGENVKEGQIIGYTGNTGNSQGAHLHYEVRYKGVRVNPLNWLDGDFECASAAVTAHLGRFESVVPQKKLLCYVIGPCTEGDGAKLLALAKSLYLPCRTE